MKSVTETECCPIACEVAKLYFLVTAGRLRNHMGRKYYILQLERNNVALLVHKRLLSNS